jgi:hypothetical protein
MDTKQVIKNFKGKMLVLHSPDPVVNFFDGLTRCRHNKPPSSGLAKDCVSCLRNLVSAGAKAAVVEEHRKLHFTLTTMVIEDALDQMEVEKFMECFNRATRTIPLTPPGGPVACIVSRIDESRQIVEFVVTTKHQTLDEWSWDLGKVIGIGRLESNERTGIVNVDQKPIVKTVMRDIMDNSRLPKHVRRAAKNWLLTHEQPPKRKPRKPRPASGGD